MGSTNNEATQPGFIVLDKTSGEMKVCEPTLPTPYEVKERIEDVLVMLDQPNPPARCHAPIPKGKQYENGGDPDINIELFDFSSGGKTADFRYEERAKR